MTAKQEEEPEGRVKDKVLENVVRRAKSGVDLVKDETNYSEVKNSDKEIVYRFRNIDCRTNHEVECRELECGYYVTISKGMATCTCPDQQPMLCKHLHAVIILSRKCYSDWDLRIDSFKDVIEELPGKKPLSSALSKDSNESHNEDGASHDDGDFSQPGSDRGQDEGDENEKIKAKVSAARAKLSAVLSVLQEAKEEFSIEEFERFRSMINPDIDEVRHYGNAFQGRRIQKSKKILRGSKKRAPKRTDNDVPDDSSAGYSGLSVKESNTPDDDDSGIERKTTTKETTSEPLVTTLVESDNDDDSTTKETNSELVLVESYDEE